MGGSLILDGRRAVVFGAGGSIGSAVARQFSADGAEVFLAGRTEESLAAVTRQITGSGGRAGYAVIDALDDAAVDRYLGQITQRAGRIDAVFNATGPRVSEYGTGTPATELPVKQFLAAQDALTSQFITARCAARRMVAQASGVIIFLTGSPARPHSPGTAAIGAAFAGIENLTRLMALELAGTGVRVVCLRTAANADSRTIRELADATAARMGVTRQQAAGTLAGSTLLKVSPLIQDTANGAALLASDRARMMTGTVHNATAGVCPD